MGTRHLIVVVHKGHQVIAHYGQYGGDQDEAGLALREILTTESFLGKLKHGLAYIEDVSLEEQEDVDAGPHGKALEKSSSFLRFMMDSSEENYQSEFRLLRASLWSGTGVAVLGMAALAPADSSIRVYNAFAKGELCDWAYAVDLDNETLKIFDGQEREMQQNRFDMVCKEAAPEANGANTDFDLNGDTDYNEDSDDDWGDTVPAPLLSVSFADLRRIDHETFVEKIKHASVEKWGREDVL